MEKTLYLAGGCFWGTEAYFKRIDGVVSTEVGYANGNVSNATYEQVCSGNTNFAEVVKLTYDDTVLTIKDILDKYFLVIDPTLLNKQGPDIGTQYRTGIYYLDDIYQEVEDYIESRKKDYKREIVTENKKLNNYYSAELYHQNYLEKNPNGYCHIDLDKY